MVFDRRFRRNGDKHNMMHKPSNKIVPLFIALLMPTLGLACSRPTETSRTEGVKDKNSPPQYTVALGSFQNLKGTPYLMSTVKSIGWPRSDKLSSYESYDSGGQTQNLVFLDTNSLESRRLFNTNASVIVQTDQYTQKVNGKDVTQWLAYQVVKSDTDGNKRLDQNDLRTLGISSASGKNYVEVLTGISEVFGLTMVNPGKLVVVYGKDKAKTVSIIDLDKRTITATQPVIDLGAQAK
jgi:hypothetical protein